MEQDTLKRLEQEVLRFIPAGEREDARQEAYLAELEGKDPICAARNWWRDEWERRNRDRQYAECFKDWEGRPPSPHQQDRIRRSRMDEAGIGYRKDDGATGRKWCPVERVKAWMAYRKWEQKQSWKQD